MLKIFSSILLLSALSTASVAHDFWLEPHQYTAAEGKKISIDWRIGDQFAGDNLVYLPDTVERMSLTHAGQTQSLSSRFASKPAIKISSTLAGSSIITLESIDFDVEYDSWEGFKSFVEKEEIGYDLPQSGELPVRERYRRYAKTIVTSDGESIVDQRTGLTFEWVLQDVSDTEARAQLWYGDQPASDFVVKVFRKPLGKKKGVEPEFFRTDADGFFVLTGLETEQEILLNSIALSFDANEEYPWYSEWASMTFAVE
jgi:hypothetical protein